MMNFTPNQKALGALLLSRAGHVLSGSFLAENVGISRQAVSKNVALLRESGFPVFSIERKGYSVNQEVDSLHPLVLEEEIRRVVPEAEVWCFDSLSSTQSVMKDFAKKGAPEGSLVLGETQTTGRGRTTRSWLSPTGRGLYFSLLLRPCLPPGHVQLLNLMAGVAVCRAIQKETSLSCDLKWPNDVLWENKKICGILSEAASDCDSIHYAVVGVGINVNTLQNDFSPEIRNVATSLAEILGKPLPRKPLLLRFYAEFMKEYGIMASRGPEAFLHSYKDFCSTLKRHISLTFQEKTLQGWAEDITDEGSLIVLVEGEKKIFHSGDVSHLRQQCQTE
jgi:BirA family biotin operon repressor/biotin-[acetyl-CoA-carboxylase] ligase